MRPAKPYHAAKRAPQSTAAPVAPRAAYVPPPEPENALRDSDLASEMFPHCNYAIHLGWDYLEDHLQKEEAVGLELNPDFQRGHTWTLAQRVAYIEHVLLGGEVGKAILVGQTLGPGGRDVVNRADGSIYVPNYTLVDGKQRMESVRMFLRGEFRVFPGIGRRTDGYRWQDLGRSLTRSLGAAFEWRRVVLPTRAAICKLYLKLNAGGTPHTPEELDRARELAAKLEAEGL